MENALYRDLNSDILVCLLTDTSQQVMCLHSQTSHCSTSVHHRLVTGLSMTRDIWKVLSIDRPYCISEFKSL